jgi:hypothetical protein
MGPNRSRPHGSLGREAEHRFAVVRGLGVVGKASDVRSALRSSTECGECFPVYVALEREVHRPPRLSWVLGPLPLVVAVGQDQAAVLSLSYGPR